MCIRDRRHSEQKESDSEIRRQVKKMRDDEAKYGNDDKVGQQGTSHQVKVFEVTYYFPTGAFEGDREHVEHNEQIAQQVDVCWNLFHVVLVDADPVLAIILYAADPR